MSDQNIIEEVALIVGGGFTPDAIGPDAHRAVQERVRANPSEYLNVFARRHLGVGFNAMAMSHLHPANLIELARDGDPERARRAAAALLAQLDAVMIVPDGSSDWPVVAATLDGETARMVERLNAQRALLRPLA